MRAGPVRLAALYTISIEAHPIRTPGRTARGKCVRSVSAFNVAARTRRRHSSR
eukprot:CAMPEP_0203960150 /NCGR_PEP_ID=MMETSP0359-20131031/90935_1 /ASSEMBLY_ACC=CAM_ASM_000338 /TAXON_ID=268821 /ORGANISM="Scrippsiella Hangoei, Strain SHTV-5" /LENGTH=52 /DNA_ID=CAMNT_0050894373 /DNA_START=37 /DNA_END=191 /DNA_ORIENTATION=-